MSAPGKEAPAAGTPDAAAVRIVRGRPTAADLAALTAVLLTRLAEPAGPSGEDGAAGTRTAGWRRPERTAPHRDPRGWRGSGSGRG
ncbi:acyl-CoA carboxylase subunit epsilon [Streptomyces sp. C10-9-1]|uniref:acyl-CoA carboxylase epsilon subunit n=1 Tax=Streptomyces sp. C10-9-1 TaxID=1859285 RepID=UPI00211367A9|nr:acyl-CoA carboxylase epsilon subunit [Streptomyces sp. C10-9-1]MCQ6552079.1 acyl-CoA carboxylase subunit epsilon [Streptomyces sp. C10-9-1]